MCTMYILGTATHCAIIIIKKIILKATKKYHILISHVHCSARHTHTHTPKIVHQIFIYICSLPYTCWLSAPVSHTHAEYINSEIPRARVYLSDHVIYEENTVNTIRNSYMWCGAVAVGRFLWTEFCARTCRGCYVQVLKRTGNETHEDERRRKKNEKQFFSQFSLLAAAQWPLPTHSKDSRLCILDWDTMIAHTHTRRLHARSAHERFVYVPCGSSIKSHKGKSKWAVMRTQK